MNNTIASTLSKVPGIGDIPILGYLFRSKAAQKQQTELVVMITPEILTNGSRGVTPNLPRGSEPFLEPIPENRKAPTPPEAFQGERRGVSTPVAVDPRTVAAAPKADPQPAAAAAAVSALTPSSRKVGVEAAPAAAAAPVPEKTLNTGEKKELDKWRREQEARERELAKAEEKAKAEEEKRLAAQAAADRRAAEQQKQRDEKLAKEQARKDAEEKKRAEEAARQELARQRERQKAVDDAAAELKAAQARYEAEVSKTTRK
jgi:hypothetical protein